MMRALERAVLLPLIYGCLVLAFVCLGAASALVWLVER